MFYAINISSAPPMRSMLGTGHAMAIQNNVDGVYYDTFFAGGVTTPPPPRAIIEVLNVKVGVF